MFWFFLSTGVSLKAKSRCHCIGQALGTVFFFLLSLSIVAFQAIPSSCPVGHVAADTPTPATAATACDPVA